MENPDTYAIVVSATTLNASLMVNFMLILLFMSMLIENVIFMPALHKDKEITKILICEKGININQQLLTFSSKL